MGNIKIEPHPRRISCDICSSRDTFTIIREGGRVFQRPTICREDLKGIVIAGLELFKDEIELPSKTIEAAPDECENLSRQLKERDAVIESLLKIKSEMEAQLKEKPKTVTARKRTSTSKSSKGKGGKKV